MSLSARTEADLFAARAPVSETVVERRFRATGARTLDDRILHLLQQAHATTGEHHAWTVRGIREVLLTTGCLHGADTKEVVAAIERLITSGRVSEFQRDRLCSTEGDQHERYEEA